MKSQIHRTSKAHLLRVAFYLLLLLAACAIPFALAQRNVATRSKAKHRLRRSFPQPQMQLPHPRLPYLLSLQSRPHRLPSSTIR